MSVYQCLAFPRLDRGYSTVVCESVPYEVRGSHCIWRRVIPACMWSCTVHFGEHLLYCTVHFLARARASEHEIMAFVMSATCRAMVPHRAISATRKVGSTRGGPRGVRGRRATATKGVGNEDANRTSSESTLSALDRLVSGTDTDAAAAAAAASRENNTVVADDDDDEEGTVAFSTLGSNNSGKTTCNIK